MNVADNKKTENRFKVFIKCHCDTLLPKINIKGAAVKAAPKSY
jgi:hypothetical protein